MTVPGISLPLPGPPGDEPYDALPDPYYADELTVLYHWDADELLPILRDTGEVGAIVTDPPYGIDLDTSSRNAWLPDHRPVHGDDRPFDPAQLLGFGVPTILWGANHYASRLPDAKGWLAWDKATRNGLDLKQAEIEFAWSNVTNRPKCYRHMWSGAYRDSERGTRYHPTQKPVALMSWCLALIPEGGGCVLDPYAGSGSVLRAAKDRGIPSVGIEIDEGYCAVIAERLAQGVLPL